MIEIYRTYYEPDTALGEAYLYLFTYFNPLESSIEWLSDLSRVTKLRQGWDLNPVWSGPRVWAETLKSITSEELEQLRDMDHVEPSRSRPFYSIYVNHPKELRIYCWNPRLLVTEQRRRSSRQEVHAHYSAENSRSSTSVRSSCLF